MPRTRVFVSYSHADSKWLDLLRTHLDPLKGALDLWDDTRIAAGAHWRSEIEKALRSAKLAVLLVSPDFLASRFITEHELPVLLAAAEAGGTRVMSLHVRSSLLAGDAPLPDQLAHLRYFQALNDPRKPLDGLTPAKRGKALVAVAEKIIAAAQAGTARDDVDPRAYLEKLRDDTRWLDVRGIGAKVAERVELTHVYTRLRVAAPTGASLDEPAAKAGLTRTPRKRDGEWRGADVQLRDLLRDRKNLVLVGDPGAGKTTFLHFVALNLARALLDDERRACLKRLGLTGQPPFPVLVKLGLFGQFLNAHPDADIPPESAVHFTRYLDYVCRGFHDGLPESFLHARVRAGGCLLLLDGLDEVPSDELRERVRCILDEVVRAGRAYGNHHIVTCRTRAYQGRVQLGGAVTRATLVDFGPEEIRAFVNQWSRAIFRVPPGEDGTAGARRAAAHCAQLVGAIEAHPHVRPLTANPLLLTILVVVHWNEKKLSEQRAELYEAAVKYLLETRKTQSPYETTLRRDCLKAIALRLFEDPEGVRKTLGRREAAEVVAPLLRVDPPRAVDFIEDEELHSGILVSRVEGEVEFRHPTFGEYLAALALLWEPDQWERIRGRLYEERWSEVVLLLAGCLRSGGLRPASAFIRKILDMDATLSGRARAVGLVGRILRDILPAGGDPAYGTGYDEARQQVLTIFEPGSDVGEPVRVEVGDALGQAGDPRIHDDDHANRVFIKGGAFWMGAQDEDPSQPGYDEEPLPVDRPVRRASVSGFWIDRYPVTVVQYRRFVDAGASGYLKRAFWSFKGWHWREVEGRSGPDAWLRQLAHPNRPVVHVTGHEAAAYCAWLAVRSGHRVRLPTDVQWEYAARGMTCRKYPWGNDAPTEQHMNYGLRVGHPTPVAIYPLGATPDRVQDLAGNVWEWCWETRDTDGTNAWSSRRPQPTLCGGAFDWDAQDCRSALRGEGSLGYASDNVGFRCVVLAGEVADDLFGTDQGARPRRRSVRTSS